MTTLLVTHDIRTALGIADRVAVLRGGRFEQIAPAAELRSSPASPYVRQLLDLAGEGSANGHGTGIGEESGISEESGMGDAPAAGEAFPR